MPEYIRAKLLEGLIKGSQNEDDAVAVFRSIPYADPPVGTLRWREPKPVTAWKGERDCTEHVAAALQAKAFRPRELADTEFTANIYKIAGVDEKLYAREEPGGYAEDCLHVDVYAPLEALQTRGESPKLPVMVWYHGGALREGTSAAYDATHLCKTGAKCIVVVAQYRLGILGYFSHPELSKEQGGSCGNYGLLDQIAALKWVQRNILAFGGDSNNVTIFGESAGGSSVTAIMVSPLAKGLFHRAISQSGQGTRTSSTVDPEVGLLLQKALGCNSISEMRKIPGSVLTKATSKYSKNLEAYALASQLMRVTNDGKIIPKHGVGEAFRRGEHHDVPLIVGFNELEGGSFFPVLPVPFPECTRNLKLMQMMPIDTKNKLKSTIKTLIPADEGLRQRLWNVYADQIPVMDDSDTDEVVMQTMMNGDTFFGAPSEMLAAYAASAFKKSKAKSPCYMYIFARRCDGAFGSKLGAFHAAEIEFVFNSNSGFRKGIPAKDDEKLARVMSNHWVEFAHNGKVQGWDPYDATKQKFMKYDNGGKHEMSSDEPMYRRFSLLEEADLVGTGGRRLNRILPRL